MFQKPWIWLTAFSFAAKGYALASNLVPGACRDGVTIVNLQPLTVVEEVPVLISTWIPQATNLVIDNSVTYEVSNAPTFIKTVVTKTCTSLATQTCITKGDQVLPCFTNAQGHSTRDIWISKPTSTAPFSESMDYVESQDPRTKPQALTETFDSKIKPSSSAASLEMAKTCACPATAVVPIFSSRIPETRTVTAECRRPVATTLAAGLAVKCANLSTTTVTVGTITNRTGAVTTTVTLHRERPVTTTITAELSANHTAPVAMTVTANYTRSVTMTVVANHTSPVTLTVVANHTRPVTKTITTSITRPVTTTVTAEFTESTTLMVTNELTKEATTTTTLTKETTIFKEVAQPTTTTTTLTKETTIVKEVAQPTTATFTKEVTVTTELIKPTTTTLTTRFTITTELVQATTTTLTRELIKSTTSTFTTELLTVTTTTVTQKSTATRTTTATATTTVAIRDFPTVPESCKPMGLLRMPQLPYECTGLDEFEKPPVRLYEVCKKRLAHFRSPGVAACFSNDENGNPPAGFEAQQCIELLNQDRLWFRLGPQCQNLAGKSGKALVEAIYLCRDELGDFAGTTAVPCLSPALGSGDRVRCCLMNRFRNPGSDGGWVWP